ncbi:MAG: DUF4118 domain-containing protein [Firmicutes bacterium]|nr:DUF4118 domain-containing protein [Bacillota bacterium]
MKKYILKHINRVLFSDFLKTVSIFLIATLLALLLVNVSAIKDNVFSVYILAVALISVVTSGYIWGIFSSFLGIFSVNYFFTYPYYAFNFLLAGYPLAFLSMLVISSIISTLTVKIKKQVLISATREKQAESLHDITKRLLTATGMNNIRTLALDYFSNFYNCSVIIYFGNPLSDKNYGIKSLMSHHTALFEQQIEQNAAQYCYTSANSAGAGTLYQTDAKCTYLPICTEDTVFGVIGLLFENERFKQPEALNFLGIMTSQLILAIERQNLFEKQQKILVETEKEKMRSNLLRAVSHDLRTPLTCIVFSATTLLENNDTLSKQSSQKLLNDIIQDAQWLIRMVENLLAITRINNKHAVIKKQYEAIEEIVSATIVKIKKRFPNYQVKVTVPEEFILIPMDATLIMQVLINLLENAICHSHNTKPILLTVVYTENDVVFSIKDNGVGLNPYEIEHIFDGVSVEKTGDSTRGLGIGLSICKSIISAHNGTISAENNTEGGATFRFTLPKKGENIDGK